MRALASLFLALLLVLPPMADALALPAGGNQDHHHFAKTWHGHGHAHGDHAAADRGTGDHGAKADPTKADPSPGDDQCHVATAAILDTPMILSSPSRPLLVASADQDNTGITGPPPLHPPSR
jgi:hypothetical protein